MHSEKERKKLNGFVSSTINEWMDLDTFSSKRKKREKEERETFVFKTVCWFNIAGTLKRKKEKRKELFLKPHNYLFGRRLLKLCYILNAPLCWNLLVMLFIYRVAFFCTYIFSFVSLSLILAKCLIHLKTL